MRAAGQPEEAIRSFRERLPATGRGRGGVLPSAELEPAARCRRSRSCPRGGRRGALDRFAVIKLNGGLATTMGLRAAEVARRGARRALVPGDHRRPDARAAPHARRPAAAGADEQRGDPRATRCARSPPTPSSTTDGLAARLPPEHDPQARRRRSLEPVSWPAAPALEWCPPGHGDVYGALRRSGMLDALLERGLPLRDDLERRQPRRDARSADRRPARRRSRSRS